MKIKLHNSLCIAKAILNRIQRRQDLYQYRDIKGQGWAEAFSNGREQGYMLRILNNKNSSTLIIAFAEYRSSDEIVIYNSASNGEGHLNEFSDEFWDSGKFFEHGDLINTVDYIFSLMREFQKKE